MSTRAASAEPVGLTIGGGVWRRPVAWAALVALVVLVLVVGWPGRARPGVVSGSAPLHARQGQQSLPLTARGPVAATLGRAEPGYWVRGLHAHNSAQRLRVGFSAAGVSVASGAGVVRFSLAGFGRQGAMRSMTGARPSAHANSVAYELGGLRAWYANGPLGLEQGFDVARVPGTGSGPLVLSISLAGDLHARTGAGGVVFSGHGVALRYTGLVAMDARGRRLPAAIGLRDGRLVISVDDRGARYPLRVDPLVQQAAFTAPDGAAGDELGQSIAISGDTIVAGAPDAAGLNRGAVYVFSDSSGSWKQTAELTASDSTRTDYLGTAVAISGNTIVASAPEHGAINQGALYVFTGGGSTWTQSAELTASDAVQGDELGTYSVGISGGTIVAGQIRHKTGASGDAGSVYVFTGGGSSWTQSAELTASDAAPNDNLGNAVTISGNTIVAGAFGRNSSEGAVYVFNGAGSAWHQTAELVPSGLGANAHFGGSVAISGDTIAAGGTLGGPVYVFSDSSGTWRKTAELNPIAPPQPSASVICGYTSFGSSVAIDGNTIVGGGGDNCLSSSPAAAVVFSDSSGTWKQTAAQTFGNGGSEQLQASVALSGDTVAAGAWDGVQKGTVFAFSGAGAGGGSGPSGLKPVTDNAALPPVRGCINRLRYTFPVHVPERIDGRVTAAVVYVNHKIVKRVRGHNIRSVSIRKLPAGHFLVKVVTVTTKKLLITSSRTYHACTKSKRTGTKHKVK